MVESSLGGGLSVGFDYGRLLPWTLAVDKLEIYIKGLARPPDFSTQGEN
jgi:hypothetical protein